MVSYHHVQYQKKLMIQSSENLVTDGQTDESESDFTGRRLTNIERPTGLDRIVAKALFYFSSRHCYYGSRRSLSSYLPPRKLVTT